MNAKSIRLEAARLAAGLDPENTPDLIHSADSIESFINFGVPHAMVEDPLWAIKRELEELRNHLPKNKWMAVAGTEEVMASLKQAVTATSDRKKPGPKAKKSVGPRPAAKRTAARKRASA